MTPSGVNRWDRGRATIDSMLTEHELDGVKADRTLADELMSQANAHHLAAGSILAIDPIGCLSLAYEASHKAFSAVLENQGLRATVKGGHKAVEEAMRAQLVPPHADLVAGFGWMRTVRHASTYVSFERAVATSDDAQRALEIAAEIIEKTSRLLGIMPPY